LARCFNEDEFLDTSPTMDFADIALDAIGIEDINNLCPDCLEELGVLFVLGFES